MESLSRLLAEVSDMLDNVSTNTAFVRAFAIPSGGTGGQLLYPSQYTVEEYIRLHIPEFDARRFVILPTGDAFTMRAGLEDREMVLAGFSKR